MLDKDSDKGSAWKLASLGYMYKFLVPSVE